MTTRCRFAPSPTGRLHVGGARTALFNLLFARNTGGRMVMRSEDTDRIRSSEESEKGIAEDLKWLGLAWDEGPDCGGPGAPYRQSERLELYRTHVQQLLDSGHAYEAWETAEELQVQRQAAQAEKKAFRYHGGPVTEAAAAAHRLEGRTPVIRLKSPGEDVSFVDAILGEVTVPKEDLDDFVVQKTDGFPTYHLAVVVDDHHMEITHVLRAQEHLMNTARHALLYRAFGWEPPTHGHMPLVFSMSGGKMSKRDKAKAARAKVREVGLDAAGLAERVGLTEEEARLFLKKKNDDAELAQRIGDAVGAELPEIDVIDFRRGGYLPEALVNFLALLGWNPGDEREIMSLDDLSQAFTLDRMGHTAAKFDRDKLRWMNGMYIREATPERLLLAMRDYLSFAGGPMDGLDDAALARILALYRERSPTLADLESQARFLFEAPTTWGPEKALRKHLLGEGLERLAASRAALSDLETWEEGVLEAALTELAERDCEGRMGKIAQPIRIALSGGPVSPPIFVVLQMLGQEESLARIDACLAAHPV